MTVKITRTPTAYEAFIDGDRVGELAYERVDSTVTALHTEVDPDAGGKGVGSALVRALIDDVRAESASLVPQCPFVASYLKKHPEDADVVA